MIKVLFLVDTLEVGGAELSLLEMLPRFKGVEPVLCQLYPGDALKARFQDAGVQVVSLDLPGRYALRQAVGLVRRLVREQRPALLHATLMRADIIARIAGRLEGQPVVNSLVSETYASVREREMAPIRRLKHRGMYIADRLTAPLAAGFIANSHAVKQASCRDLGIDPRRVEVIYRGRDLARFAMDKAERGPSDRPTTGHVGRPLIVNVGRLCENKGQAELIRAMPALLTAYPDACLLIAGEGPYRAVLTGLIADLGLAEQVFLLGHRYDIPALLQAADLFVSPSHYEGLPGAVIEAMLAGVPVALSNMNVHREMVVDGDNGRLFPLRDISALATTMLSLLDQPELARAMAQRARRQAFELFDIDKAVARHERFYERLLQGFGLRGEDQ